MEEVAEEVDAGESDGVVVVVDAFEEPPYFL